jgi:signal transduction histidine kinase/CheY-like chemotaxis protein
VIELSVLSIRDENSIVECRNKIRNLALSLDFSSVAATQLATATSELCWAVLENNDQSDISIGFDRMDGMFGLVMVFQGIPEKFKLRTFEFFFDHFIVYPNSAGGQNVKTFKYFPDLTFVPSNELIEAEKIKLNQLSRDELMEKLKRAIEASDAANKAKSDFLANMSHEIRTPMNAILGYAQILTRDNTLAPNHNKSIHNILSSGNHLLELINEILDLSKIEAGRMEINSNDFDLIRFIEDLSVMFKQRCEEKHLIWSVDNLDLDSLPVNGDETKLRQVLINLLGNAVKFTNAGEVSFSISKEGDDQYKFQVTDTGKGIPLEVQNDIFNPFQQDREGIEKGGTGLGLAIAKKQVDLMGGDLCLRSELGKGASFFFSLKLISLDEEVLYQSSQVKKATHLAKGFSVKALVVDDIETNRDILTEVLKSAGIETWTATNGQEAVDFVRKQVPDIIFMDIQMPIMNGIEATKIIKNEFKNEKIKVVAVTASAFKHQVMDLEDAGCDEFISKPVQLDQLFESISNQLGVGFEYEEEAPTPVEDSNKDDLDLSQISLPKEIYERLKEAVDSYNLTDSLAIILDIENLEGNGPVFGKLLRKYIESFDFEKMHATMEQINYE